MDYLKAFIVGGLICAVGQILIDKTKLTPARILVTFVVVGVFLQLIKIYQPLVDFAGAGATVPDRKSTRLNSSHRSQSRMPSSA